MKSNRPELMSVVVHAVNRSYYFKTWDELLLLINTNYNLSWNKNLSNKSFALSSFILFADILKGIKPNERL